MNQRIRQLIEQAEDPEHGFVIPEKLAELIVKECRDMFVVNSPSWNLLNEKIEHFGVEE